MSPTALQTVYASSRRWASLSDGQAPPHELTFPQLIARRAAQLPDRELVVDSSARYTFGQFEHEMMRAARAAIAAGVVPGDRVAIWAPNSARWLVAAMGASAAGAVLAPMNTRFKGLEAADAVDRVSPRLLFTVRSFLGTDYPAILRAAVTGPLATRIIVLDGDVEAPDLTWEQFITGGETVPLAQAEAVRDSISPQTPSDIVLTSGTTGHPKGVITRHDQNVLAYIRHIEHLGFVDGERVYVTLPFFHNFGLKAGFIVPVMLGGACVCDAVFDTNRLLQSVEQERISYLPGTPTVFSSLLDDRARADHDLTSLKKCFVAGSMLSVELIARIKKELGIEVFTGYGLSEIAGAVTLTPSGGTPERVAEWAGSIVEGVEVRIIDDSGRDVPRGAEGEILARSDCVMTGYLDDQSATVAAIDGEGWLHTGDIGAFDSEGYIKILGRKKDMFITGGFNVYPAEIEQLFLRHPAVQQVAVVGMPDGRLGEVGAAFVVQAPGETATPEELTSWARQNMSNFKVPRRVTIMDALPMNTSLKVLKGELRKLAAQAR